MRLYESERKGRVGRLGLIHLRERREDDYVRIHAWVRTADILSLVAVYPRLRCVLSQYYVVLGETT